MHKETRRRYIDGMVENFNELLAVHTELRKDISLAVPNIADDASVELLAQLNHLSIAERRAVIRAIFACIEASSFYMRKHIVLHNGNLLSREVSMALSEQQIDVSTSGGVDVKPLRASAISLLRLTVRVFGECYPPVEEYGLQGSACVGREFECVIPALRVRDRITHPKRIADLAISNEELATAASAFRWFDKFVVNSIALVAAHTLSDAKGLEAEIQRLQEAQARYESRLAHDD
jgi:hypothetical protein